MNRFNLTFKGEILPGKEPERVKLRFGKMFAIDDPERLERFFSGQTIILRGNLERKVAAEYFQKLRQLGVEAELVKVTAEETAGTIARDPTPTPASIPTPTDESLKPALRGMDHEILERKPGQVDQSWAVSSSRANRAPVNKEAPTTEALLASAASAGAERKASLAEKQRLDAEEAAQREAELAEKKRLEAKEVARQKVLLEEVQRKAAEEAEEAARQKALQKEAERKAAEEAARRTAELVEKKRLEAEEAARQKALQEETGRKAAEEAAQREAELAEKKRLEAEEATRQKALQEAAERKAAEEEARKKAEELARQQAIKEEARRKAAEEAARKKALREEAKRKAAQETAQRKAELAKKKRIEAQEAARLKAELAEKKRKAAEEEARKQAILKEEKRKAAAKAARLKAEQEEQARKAAAEVALLKAEHRRLEQENAAALAAEKIRQQQERELEQQRIAAAEAAEQQAQEELKRRKAAAREAREKARKAEEKRQLAEQAVRRKAQERLQKEQQQIQLKAEHNEQAAQRQAMEEQAIRRGAAELSQRASLKPVKARVKTKLAVGQRRSRQEQGPDLPRRRQKGEPNLYSLRPFRNTTEVRARAEQAHQRMRTGFTVAAVALAALLLLGGRLMSIPPAQAITGASAVVIDPQSRPLLLAGDSLLLHDRSGIGSDTVTTDSLGLDTLQAPMAFNDAGELLTMGRLKTDTNRATSKAGLQLIRCNIEQLACQLFSDELADSSIAGFAIHPLDGAVFLADTATGELLKASADGVILARATTTIPDKPVLRLESGLLFMNSALGPGVSVFRYDDSAFGQQLDEILLLPPAAVAAEQTRVSDFVLTADNWWASMYNPETGSAGLYRFDTQWNFVDEVALMADTQPQQLVNWGEKTLVRDVQHIPIQRFNAQGEPEAALISNLLESLVSLRQRSASLTHAAWLIALVASTVILVVGLCLGNLQRLRGLVYKAHRERGADPIDEYAEEVLWVDPAQDRPIQLRRTGISYTILSIALILLAMWQGVAVIPLVALLAALSGPAIGLVLLSRSHTGHIGVLAEQLVLVDHSGMYHLGAGPRIQHRGPFLLIDDVVVFSGSKNLPAFSSKQVQAGVTPLAQAGIKVDRTTVLVKLLQSQHPLAQGALATLATLAAALVLLALQGIF